MKTILQQAVARGMPGVSAAIATRAGVIWTGTAGLADLDVGTAMEPWHLFGIGSITKTFVAVVILQLAQEGRLALNTRLRDVLGRAIDGIANADQATLAQLLNHTSGVPSWEDDPRWIRQGRGAELDVDRVWYETETLAYLRTARSTAANAPGAAYHYSNSNYTLLGLVIEAVTGATAAAEIRRRILAPLDMQDTGLEGFEPLARQRLAHRYHFATAEFRRDAGVNAAFVEVRPGLIDVSRSNLSVEWLAGGMVSSASDLVRYAVALRDGQLLKPDTLRVLLQWHPLGGRGGGSVGHGLFREPAGADGLIGHEGNVLGFTAAFYWTEKGDAAVALLANAGSVHSGRVPVHAGLLAREAEFLAALRETVAAGPSPRLSSPAPRGTG